MILFISPASICGKLIMAEKVYIQIHYFQNKKPSPDHEPTGSYYFLKLRLSLPIFTYSLYEV